MGSQEVCCVPSLSLQHPREGHFGALLKGLDPLFNNFHFQEFLIYFCPEFLAVFKPISHIKGACCWRTHTALVPGDFLDRGSKAFSRVLA